MFLNRMERMQILFLLLILRRKHLAVLHYRYLKYVHPRCPLSGQVISLTFLVFEDLLLGMDAGLCPMQLWRSWNYCFQPNIMMKRTDYESQVCDASVSVLCTAVRLIRAVMGIWWTCFLETVRMRAGGLYRTTSGDREDGWEHFYHLASSRSMKLYNRLA